MTYEVYRYVFLGGIIASGVMLAVTILLFFVLKIPKVFNDLTGRSAKKAIENIRRQNEATGNKRFQSSSVNLKRGKLTDKISKSGRLQSRGETPFGVGRVTEKIATQNLDTEEDVGATTVLSVEDETTILEAGSTEELHQPETPQPTPAASCQPTQEFSVDFEITYLNTDEVIA